MVDIGFGVSHSVAIHEGYAYPHTLNRLDLGGGDIDKNIAALLEENSTSSSRAGGGAASDHAYQRQPDEVYTALKLEHGRVAVDFAQESFALRSRPGTAPTYTLPDGKVLQLQNEHIRGPEAMFQPALAGCRGAGVGDLLWENVR